MRRRVSRVREWSDCEIGLAVNRKTKNLHTNFVQKLNDEVAATMWGGGEETGEMRLGFWSGEVAVFLYAVLDKLPHHLKFSLFMRLGLWSHAS
jgi:hypothetical protein